MKDKDINIVGGLLLGLAIGYTLAILTAPEKGSEFRSKLGIGAKSKVKSNGDLNVFVDEYQAYKEDSDMV